MGRLGVVVEAGGNQVFFANGALSILGENKIEIDTLIGFSSATPVILATLVGKNNAVAESFATQLDTNPHNFYLFRRPHLPHTTIYRTAVTEIVEKYVVAGRPGHFSLIGTQSSSTFASLKAFIATGALGLKRTPLLPIIRRILGLSDVILSQDKEYSAQELTEFIIGSSSIYPFIKPSFYRGRLILEGALANTKPVDLLDRFDKKLVIHTEKGISGLYGGVFHVYASSKVPFNVLDYTDGSAVRHLHQAGRSDMQECLPELQAYLK